MQTYRRYPACVSASVLCTMKLIWIHHTCITVSAYGVLPTRVARAIGQLAKSAGTEGLVAGWKMLLYNNAQLIVNNNN